MLRESGLFLAPEISHLAAPGIYAWEKFETEKSDFESGQNFNCLVFIFNYTRRFEINFELDV